MVTYLKLLLVLLKHARDKFLETGQREKQAEVDGMFFGEIGISYLFKLAQNVVWEIKANICMLLCFRHMVLSGDVDKTLLVLPEQPIS